MKSSVRLRMRELFHSPEEVLHACIRDDDVAELRRLVERPNIADSVNHDHYAFGTPLCVAVWCDRLAVVGILLDAGADPLAEIVNEASLSPLMLAIKKGHRGIAQRLWAHVPPKSHANGSRSFPSCLYQAAYYGQASLVDQLLIWWDGWTDAVKEEALLAAASRWHVHVVALMLSKLTLPDHILVEALHTAAEFKPMMGDEERTEVQYDGVDFLNQGCLIARIIDAGADPNTPLRGRNVLYEAASALDLASGLKALLEKGADPNAQNPRQNGQSALHLLGSPVPVRAQLDANCRLHETGIRLLLRYGASILQPDAAGNTPLHRAAFGADVRVFQLYLSSPQALGDQHSILTTKNLQGETPLHWAAAGGKIDIVEYLIFRGLNVNATSSNGWTPLICALAPTVESDFPGARAKGSCEAIQAAQLLLFHGANPLVSTAERWTPLHCLARYLDADDEGDAARLAEQLTARGVDIEARATLLSRSNLSNIYPQEAEEALRRCRSAWGYEVPKMIELGAGKGGFVGPGLTPLHWAAEFGALGVAKALLAHGADPGSKSPSGNTPAQLADRATLLLPASLRLKERLIRLFTGAGDV